MSAALFAQIVVLLWCAVTQSMAQCTNGGRCEGVNGTCCSGVGGGGCYDNTTAQCCQQSWAAQICALGETCCGYGARTSATSFCCGAEQPVCCGDFCCAQGESCGASSCIAANPSTRSLWSLPLASNSSPYTPSAPQLLGNGSRYAMVVLTTEVFTTDIIVVDADYTNPNVACRLPNATNAVLFDALAVLVVATNHTVAGFALPSCRRLWSVTTATAPNVNTDLNACGPFAAVSTTADVLYMINTTTGHIAAPIESAVTSACISNTMFVYGYHHVTAYDASTAEKKWTQKLAPASGDRPSCCGMGVSEDQLVLCLRDSASSVYSSLVYNAATGNLTRKCAPLPSPWVWIWTPSLFPVAYFWGPSSQYVAVNVATCSFVSAIQSAASVGSTCYGNLDVTWYTGHVCGSLVVSNVYADWSPGDCQQTTANYVQTSNISNSTFNFLGMYGVPFAAVESARWGCFIAQLNAVYAETGVFTNVTFTTPDTPQSSVFAPIVSEGTAQGPVLIRTMVLMANSRPDSSINLTAWPLRWP